MIRQDSWNTNRKTISKQCFLASEIVQLYCTLHAHALFISGVRLCLHQTDFERWFFSHVLVLRAPCMYCSDLKITPQRIKIIKMNFRLYWRPRQLGLVGFSLIFGLNFKGNSSLTAPTPSGIRKNYCNLNLSSGDFCLEHSMADFRVYFQDFRKEFMIFKRYLDSFSALDVCQNPSLRQNTMIPLILSPR